MTFLKWISLLVANYYASTLALWLGHWVSHQRHSPTHEFHVGGHHRLYPNAAASLSARFLYGTGKNDSLVALLPALLVQAVMIAIFFRGGLRWALLAEEVVVAGTCSWVHTQFHVGRSPLQSFPWFKKARREHWVHHDQDVNFMVADPFWDRVFSTYAPASNGGKS
jgi:sterol desaturase/sphingolipid hydroxylase (fatty acid hydroxylase superfamily)